jgi:cytochrome P450
VAGSSVTYNGRTYPTAGHMVAVLQAALHRDPKVWSNPNDFEPDRFLQADVNESGSWQPFEKGRNCIGQQLALLEAKVIVTLTARYFDFEAAFNSHGLSIPGWGGRAYQMVQLTAKPKDGIPVKVKLTNRI